MTRPAPSWTCRGRAVDWRAGPLVMGVLNVTPDSFSDGGRFFRVEDAVARGCEMAADGATILDIGGESSRPGAQPVPVDEELRRVVPVIEALARRTECLLSVDTTKAAVAEAAIGAGAHLINDITALAGDPAMAGVARSSGAGVVLMHMQGTPRTMQQEPRYGDVVAEVRDYLGERMRALEAFGLAREAMAVDPGIGFGKSVEHNVALLGRLEDLGELGRPVVVGVSRKSFLGHLTGRALSDRLGPSLAAMVYALARGAHVARVHDVKESCELARLVGMFNHAKGLR